MIYCVAKTNCHFQLHVSHAAAAFRNCSEENFNQKSGGGGRVEDGNEATMASVLLTRRDYTRLAAAADTAVAFVPLWPPLLTFFAESL